MHTDKMSSIYGMIGITKQGHYKRVAHQERMVLLSNEIVKKAAIIRHGHKKMGCRKMFYAINPDGIGRDKTEAILLSNGFRVKRKRNYRRTTYAGKHQYDNHIRGMKVTDVNQLWVSDITYVPAGHAKQYYLTLVQDVYSRKIVGWCFSKVLQASQSVFPAYKNALEAITEKQRRGLIFHSDRGSQYIWGEMKALHRQYGVTPSMGGKAWENAHAESINGVLKNEYIDFEGMDISFSEAKKQVASTIRKYNEERPHGSLKNMKPVEFESYVKQLNDRQKPIFEINY